MEEGFARIKVCGSAVMLYIQGEGGATGACRCNPSVRLDSAREKVVGGLTGACSCNPCGHVCDQRHCP